MTIRIFPFTFKHNKSMTIFITLPQAGRTQTNNAQLYLGEPCSVHNQLAYAMNNAEPLCAGVWRFGAQLFSQQVVSQKIKIKY